MGISTIAPQVYGYDYNELDRSEAMTKKKRKR
jgi:hypothetical protein